MQLEQQTILRKRSKKKIRKGIASSRGQTLSREALLGKRKRGEGTLVKGGKLVGYATGLANEPEEEE